MKKQKKPYWYFFTHFNCVLCGHHSVIKERRYTPKPERIQDTFEVASDYEGYCGCDP